MDCIKPNCNKVVASKKAQLCATHYDQDIFRKKKPLYRTWQSMKSRCYDSNTRDYNLYGGRGITVCERWLNSYDDFVADMGVRPEGMTLDRINPDGNYEPGNVRWATPKEQITNRRAEAKPRKTNKSGAIGVRLHNGRWQARGRFGKHLGSFGTKEEAIKVRKENV